MRGFFETPRLPRERRPNRGRKSRRSLLRCRHSKYRIEGEDCLVDPRLIDPFFSAMPRGALASPLARETHGRPRAF
jgi:hypothetical protein